MRSTSITLKSDYSNIGRQLWRRFVHFPASPPTPNYSHTLTFFNDRQLLMVSVRRTTHPYWSPELMAHVRRHLPHWNGFHTRTYTYVQMNWSSIFGDWDWSAIGTVVQVEEQLQQRDRLMQLFEACPKYSYGYYASFGLAPFKSVVGSFAAATIDEFFASKIQILKQPMSYPVNDIMSQLETRYWDDRPKIVEWLAGKTFTKTMRELGVSIPQNLLTLWEGQPKPQVPTGEEPEERQLAVAADILREHLPSMESSMIDAYVDDLYEKMVAAAKEKREKEKAGDQQKS